MFNNFLLKYLIKVSSKITDLMKKGAGRDSEVIAFSLASVVFRYA